MVAFGVSLAVPGSVIENTQSWEQATMVAGQIARAAVVFNISEVVVIDDSGVFEEGRVGHGAAFLARVLQYLETPQYLRKHLIPMHKDLRLAGTLPPLDAHHHLRVEEWKPYREGVVTSSIPGDGSFVDIGLEESGFVDSVLVPGTRVTLQCGKRPKKKEKNGQKVIKGKVVSPDTPAKVSGIYWGYTTRIAKGLGAVFSECPYPGGYDLLIGTSEHGEKVGLSSFKLPNFERALVAFGGPKGLEDCAKLDPELSTRNFSDLFQFYVNTCPNQGSRTIRTEEAIWLSLACLQEPLDRAMQGVINE